MTKGQHEGTGANGKKFRTLDTVAHYSGLTDTERRAANTLIDGTTQDRVEFIWSLMAEMRFQSHRTAKELAQIWNIHVSTARNLCSQAYSAFRILAQHERSPEEIRAEINLKYESLTRMALENKKAVVVTNADKSQHIEYVEEPDIKAAITAQKAYAELNGAHRNAAVEARKNKYLEEDKSMEDLLKEIEELRNEDETMEDDGSSGRDSGTEQD